MPRSLPLASLASSLALAAALVACGGAGSSAPPRAEFVVTAGDTSLWVRTGPDAGPDGVEVRRAPLLLARVDGRFHELYVTEDDYSFHDALFAAQTVWRRDLVTGDSIVVHGDPTAPRLAIAYGRRHPHEQPLAPDEDGAEDPAVMAVTEAYVAEVHGPLATIETFDDMHPDGGEPSHRSRLRLVDLRRGVALTLADLLGDSVSARVEAHGRAAFARARDSVRVGRAPRGDAGHRAAAALGRLTFDERSFTLTEVRSQPGVVFHVPVTNDDADGHALPLPPIPVPAGDWWREARGALPAAGDHDAVARWPRDGYAVEARRDRDGDRLVLRDSAGRDWPLARLTGGVERVYWLDRQTSAADRHALARAFYEATLYDGTLRATARGGAAAMPAFRPVTHHP